MRVSGGMIARPAVFFAAGAAVGFLFCAMFGMMLLNLLIYGHLGGPCVWPVSDAVGMGGVDLSALEWSERLQCYLNPDRTP